MVIRFRAGQALEDWTTAIQLRFTPAASCWQRRKTLLEGGGMNRWKRVLPLAALLTMPLAAQTSKPAAGKAKLSKAEAERIALAKEPGKAMSSELEREHSKLIYSFNINTENGMHEVNVDAITGKIVEDSVESAADEAKEAAQDKKAQKKPAPPRN
jgi:hypothetical protein